MTKPWNLWARSVPQGASQSASRARSLTSLTIFPLNRLPSGPFWAPYVSRGGGGGSPTHFSHPLLDAYYGLLRDVSAARRLSRSAFGGRCQPRPLAPGDLDRACQNCISLLRTGGLLVIEIVVRVILSLRAALVRGSEYFIPYLLCYSSCFFFCVNVSDQ